jgi:hypothetical protein
MADEKNMNQDAPNEGKALGAAAGAPFATESQNTKAQRGGPQEDQLAGETESGAHTQTNENRNPSGNAPNQNRQARQEGNKL